MIVTRTNLPWSYDVITCQSINQSINQSIIHSINQSIIIQICSTTWIISIPWSRTSVNTRWLAKHRRLLFGQKSVSRSQETDRIRQLAQGDISEKKVSLIKNEKLTWNTPETLYVFKSDHSNESYWAVLSCSAVYYAVQCGYNVWICGWNPNPDHSNESSWAELTRATNN